GEVGRSDGFVRFLRVLGLCLVLAWRRWHVVPPIELLDGTPRCGDRLRRDLHAVGSHIGDQAFALAAEVNALIEPLSELHGMARGEAELTRGLLLERRGGEGRRR